MSDTFYELEGVLYFQTREPDNKYPQYIIDILQPR